MTAITPVQIKDTLDNCKSFDAFQNKVCYYFKHYPFTMSSNKSIIGLIGLSPWMQDVDLILDYFKINKSSNLSHPNKAYIAYSKDMSQFFSYIGSVIDFEEFWLKVLERDPHLAKFWFRKTDSFKAAQVLIG